MKKNIYTLIVSVFLVCFLAAPVLAEDAAAAFGYLADVTAIPDSDPGGAGITGLQFSPNVEFAYDGDGNNYTAATYNTSGTKSYAVTNHYSGIYQTVENVKEVPPAAASAQTWESTTWTEVAK